MTILNYLNQLQMVFDRGNGDSL